MATMTVARCPKCQIEVGSTWRWCLACGYDPDGSAQRVRQAAIEARQREGGWLPVLIVLLGLVIGGAVLWRTTPDDTAPTGSASTAAEVEVDQWIPFTPPGGGFRVELPAAPPSTPAQGTSAAGTVVETYAVGVGDHLFSVSVLGTGGTDLGDAAATEAALRAYVDELARAVSGEVTVADVDVTGVVPRLDFRIEHGTMGEMRGRVIVFGGSRLASGVVSSRELNSEIADHVTQSLGPT